MSFKTELCLKVIGKQAYEVIEPLVYDNGRFILQVNPKFDFDGASIPKALWSVIGSPMTGGYQRAACMHDALYASECFDRKTCDDLFLQAMKDDGIGFVRRRAMYLAVRAAGWLVWDKHNQLDVSKYKTFVSVVTL